MSPIGEGWHAVLAILAACALPTQVWRWIGVAIGQAIDADSEVLVWVRAVATAIICAFVARVVFFPTGALAEMPLWLRLGAVAIGVAAYAFGRRIVFVGVAVGVAALMIGAALLRW